MSQTGIIEGTHVLLSDNTVKRVEELRIDDKLLSFNLNTFDDTQDDNLLKSQISEYKDGEFKESIIKNIWTDSLNSYYQINNTLNIGRDNIAFIKRNNNYLWCDVNQLKIVDFLLTNKNKLEKIETINKIHEEVFVYNIQLNSNYTYFVNQYLIHNGNPCWGCSSCGSYGCFEVNSLVYLTDGSTKKYGELVVGDVIKSFSITNMTETDDPDIYLTQEIDTIEGSLITSEVETITTHTTDTYYFINESIKVTAEHPIFIKRDNKWKWRLIDTLVVDDKMFDLNQNEININSIETITNDTITIATIDVGTVNTYFVNNILAHNK